MLVGEPLPYAVTSQQQITLVPQVNKNRLDLEGRMQYAFFVQGRRRLETKWDSKVLCVCARISQGRLIEAILMSALFRASVSVAATARSRSISWRQRT